jgi:hypothetical protein
MDPELLAGDLTELQATDNTATADEVINRTCCCSKNHTHLHLVLVVLLCSFGLFY